MKSTSLLHHFGHFLYHYYTKIGRFYIISISSKNLPAKSLHHFYTIITDFYTVPTPKSSESTPLLHHSGIQCTHRCKHKICCQRTGYFVQIQSMDTLFDTFYKSPKKHIISTPFLHHARIVFLIFISFLYR